MIKMKKFPLELCKKKAAGWTKHRISFAMSNFPYLKRKIELYAFQLYFLKRQVYFPRKKGWASNPKDQGPHNNWSPTAKERGDCFLQFCFLLWNNEFVYPPPSFKAFVVYKIINITVLWKEVSHVSHVLYFLCPYVTQECASKINVSKLCHKRDI